MTDFENTEYWTEERVNSFLEKRKDVYRKSFKSSGYRSPVSEDRLGLFLYLVSQTDRGMYCAFRSLTPVPPLRFVFSCIFFPIPIPSGAGASIYTH